MLKFFLQNLQKTLFYPYQLFFKSEKKGNERFLLKYAKGKIADIGCGSANYKDFCLSLQGVTSYIAVDYPGWGENFKKSERLASRLGIIGSILLRSSQVRPVAWIDGTNLGLKTETLDTVVSFGVLEHVKNYEAYLSEVARVLKKEGYFIITIPFLYQAHGGKDSENDFYRWTPHGLKYVIEKSGLQCVEIESFGGPGTMFSQLINSWLIKKIDIYNINLSFISYVVYGILLAPVFFCFNMLFWIIDRFDQDMAYATGFRAAARKRS